MKTREITGGGMMAAAVVVLLYLSVPLPSLTLTCAAFAGFLVMFVYLKWGVKSALLCYSAASFLSMLLLPRREAAVEFIFLFGLYPMFKTLVERIPSGLVCWTFKVIYCNGIVGITYLIARTFLTLPEDLVGNLLFTAVLLNVTFILYDIAFTKVIRILQIRYKKLLS